jgi:hypothetical protein
MHETIVPTSAVLGFGSKHNPKVWSKHRSHLSETSRLDAVLDICKSKLDKLTRQDVFDIAKQDGASGVIASIVWGFPRGGRPGGQWKSFADAFEVSERFAVELAALRHERVPAFDGIIRLNRIVKGVGFATTTKIAYFAGVQFKEGKALIFDANVIKAISSLKSSWADVFPRTRAALGSTNFYPKATRSYGLFIHEATAYAAERDTTPDAVEISLFRDAARPGVWS